MDAALLTSVGLAVGAVLGGVVAGFRGAAASQAGANKLGANLGPRVEHLAKDVAYIQGHLKLPIHAPPDGGDEP